MYNSHFADAVKCGNLEGSDDWIDAGADVNTLYKDTVPVLIFAVEQGHNDLVKLLLSKGAIADVRTGNEYDETALMIAITNGYNEIAELLISSGAGTDEKEPMAEI